MSELLTMAWVDVAEKVKTTDLALVPVGAVEVYGPHMPQGTDGIVAAALCRSLSERVDCLVAPLVPVGYSAALQDFPGTLSVPPQAVKEYCRGIAESLLKFGVRRILYVNGHAGNVPAALIPAATATVLCGRRSKDLCLPAPGTASVGRAEQPIRSVMGLVG